MIRPLPIGVLVSGSGTNLQAIVNAIESGRLPAEIRLVVCNRPGAQALERARSHGLETALVDHRQFPRREAFDRHVVGLLQACGVELVCLAGFDRIVSAEFVEAFRDRILNIHPALLPAFPGLHAQRQAVDYGVKLAGCTVHFVDEKPDHGPIVIQAVVPVLEEDTPETLAARILEQEHRIYPEAIRLFAEGRLRIEGRRVRILEPTEVRGALANPPPRD
jgi:phosphoribosylglycinamide formyltransferase-1